MSALTGAQRERAFACLGRKEAGYLCQTGHPGESEALIDGFIVDY
jgi:hypothetical protein